MHRERAWNWETIMGTVGLSFGSATSGTGFDVTSTVNSILAIQSAIETPWQTQLTALQSQDTALSSLGTDLSTLTTSLQNLTDVSGVFSGKEGSSSDTNVLALSSADPSAVAGSHTVVVNTLASTASEYTDLVSDSTASLSGTLQIGSNAAITVSAANGNNTISSLAAAINSADEGVTASVISDATGSRLSLTASTGGSAGQAVINGITSSLSYTTASNSTPTALNVNAGQTGVNGSLTVDGVTVSTSSNTVAGAIPGVTFQVLATGTSQIEITNNNASVESAVSAFVTAYNAVNTDISTQEGKDSSGNAEPLYGNPTLSLIQSQLSLGLVSGTASGSISNLSQLGITVNADGSLALNTSTLDSVLNSNYSDVTGFLQNSGSFGQTFAATLNNLGTQAPDGAIYLLQQQNSAQETALNTSITNENASIATEKTALTTELNQANEILQSIPSQLNEINEIYSAFTGYGTQSTT